jgi:hypothetical protein
LVDLLRLLADLISNVAPSGTHHYRPDQIACRRHRRRCRRCPLLRTIDGFLPCSQDGVYRRVDRCTLRRVPNLPLAEYVDGPTDLDLVATTDEPQSTELNL